MPQSELRGKLVRDNIPELMLRLGQVGICVTCDYPLQRLCDKLVEETRELMTVSGKDNILPEAADVYEVLRELYRERKVQMSPLALTYRVGYKDCRKDLYDCARLVHRSVAAIGVLEQFSRQFAKILDEFHINEHELERKRQEKCKKNGGFNRRLVLWHTIEHESLPQP